MDATSTIKDLKLAPRIFGWPRWLKNLAMHDNGMSDTAEQMIRQEHLFIAVCGHDGSGKGSTTGRLLFQLDGTSKREPDGPTPEAERLEKLFLATALNMDDLKGKTERGGIPERVRNRCLLGSLRGLSFQVCLGSQTRKWDVDHWTQVGCRERCGQRFVL